MTENETPPARIGKYQILQTLGVGGMGVVYLGFDPVIERKVAIKTIRKDLLGNAATAEATARFRREAMAAGKLSHPGIVGVFDYGEDEQVAFIVMEFAPGKDLFHYAAGRALPLPEVGSLMTQLLAALGHAHAAGVVHRDIKPSNLLLSDRLKITDFGIARVENSQLTQVGVSMGTPAYMAPEQFMGIGVDQRVDLFAAGVIFFELLTGRQPFEGTSLEELSYKICHTEPPRPSSLRWGLPAGVDAVTAIALAKDKDARFQNASAFAHALTAALEGRPLDFQTPASLRAFGSAATIASQPPQPGAPHPSPPYAGTPNPSAPPPVAAVVGTPPSSRVSAPPASTAQISSDHIARVTQALATHVGPIAKVMVKKAVAEAGSYQDLCDRLSQRLGTDAERTRFLKDAGKG